MFLDDLEDDKSEDPDLINNETRAAFQPTFVGRHKEREEIKNVLKERAKIVQIAGPPMIGKSALAEQVTKELEDELREMDCKLKIGTVHMSEEASANFIKLNLAHIFDLPIHNSTTDFDLKLNQRLKELNRVPDYYYLIGFHNCEQCAIDRDFQEELISIVMKLAKVKRVVILLTSRVKFSFLCLNERLVYTKMLEPLEVADAKELLKKSAPGVNFTGLSKQIVTMCDCFPYPIIMAGRKLQECQQILTPTDLLEALGMLNFKALSMEFGSIKSAPESIVKHFIDGLEEHLKKYLAILIYFPGSFSTEAAKYLTEVQRLAEIKMKALLPLSDRCMIQCCADMASRFSVHPFIRKCASQQLSHLRADDVVRLRFAKFFGEVIIDANKNLFNQSTVAMMKYLNCDWQNIEHLLQEAIHPVPGNRYSVYMQVVKNGDEFLQTFVPEKCVSFFKSCLDVAEKFGTREDVALLQSNIGCAIASSKGSSLNEAMSWYEKALPVLEESNYHSHYNKLLLQMGWNWYQQGQIKTAQKIHKSVMRSLMNDECKDDDYVKHRLFITSCSRLTQSLIFLRRYAEAKKILDTTLEYANKHVPYHPQRSIMMNSLGLIEQRESRNMNKAIRLYKASLALRRPFATHRSTLIIPLNNLASALMILNRYDEALVYIKEARQICKSGDWENTSTGLTLLHCGRLHYLMGQYEESIVELKEAERIYKKCTPKHISLSKTRFYLGLAFKSIGYRNRALAEFHDLINNRESLILGYDEDRELLIVGSLREAMSLCSEDDDYVNGVDSPSLQLWNYYCEILEKELNEFAEFHKEKQPDLSTKYRSLKVDLISQRDQSLSGETQSLTSSTNLSMIKYADCVY